MPCCKHSSNLLHDFSSCRNVSSVAESTRQSSADDASAAAAEASGGPHHGDVNDSPEALPRSAGNEVASLSDEETVHGNNNEKSKESRGKLPSAKITASVEGEGMRSAIST